MAPAAVLEPHFKKDEKALCFHHELLYESKILDVRPVDGDDKKSGFEYKVHYKGWKNTYVLLLTAVMRFAHRFHTEEVPFAV
jgi:mortality factor 4-like protein 1